MARSLRVEYEGARYHIINRGNYRKDLFNTAKTAEYFTKVLLEASERYEWWLHAYVIMSNHYHLCVETPKANLVEGMHWLQSSFANAFSRFSSERGHVFQGRYKSLVIEGDGGLLNVVDYIHLNPVRAQLLKVEALKEYPHSSFPQYLQKNRHPRLRCEDFLQDAGGLKASLAGIRKYQQRLEWIMEENPQQREQRFQNLSKGWYIGTQEGKKALTESLRAGECKASAQVLTELQELNYEKRLEKGLKVLKKNLTDIENDKKSALWKLALASWLKKQYSIKNQTLSHSLHMGHPATMSNYITHYRKQLEKRCSYQKRLRKYT